MLGQIVSCSACGSPVKVQVDGPFSSAAIAAAFCPVCIEQHFLDNGGAILAFRQELNGSRFPLGKITVTSGAVGALAEASQHAVEFLMRHVQGDWGSIGHVDQTSLTADEERRGWESTSDSAKINKWNLLKRHDRLMSEYATIHGKQIWIVTALDGCGGTTVLLPSEY